MNINTTRWTTFPIFISSTFKDMDAERDMIKKIIIPGLEEYLKERRVELKVIDLRWGVDTNTGNEAVRDSEVLKVCLDVIKNNRPFFIGLLGERYGWIPPVSRWENLYHALADDEKIMLESGKEKSVTELEILFGALGNAKVLPRSLFYFRNKKSYDNVPVSLRQTTYKYWLEEEKEKHSDGYQDETKMDNLKEKIRSVCKKNNYDNAVREYSLKWDEEKNKFVDVDFCEQLYQHLLQEILEEIEDTDKDKIVDWYEEENNALNDFVYAQTKDFVGRTKLIGEITELLIKEKQAMIITGFSGSGKSAIFCKIYQKFQSEKQKHWIILAHSTGITPDALYAENMLRKWIKTICGIINCDEKIDEKKEPAIALSEKFAELVILAEKSGFKIIMLVDAIDRFDKSIFSEYMQWLPENVSFFATSLPETIQKPLKIHPFIQIKSLNTFTDKEAENMMKGRCHAIGKQLPGKVLDHILKKQITTGKYAYISPLWLQLVGNVLIGLDADDFKEIREQKYLNDYEQIEIFLIGLIDKFSGDAGEVFIEILRRAAGDYGSSLTDKSMEYLSISRNGLREKDLAVLLDNDWNELKFALLRRWLGRLITEDKNNRQWKLSHNLLNKAITEKSKANLQTLHNKLSLYLLTLPDDDPLRVSETMYHLLKADNLKDAANFYATIKDEASLNIANRILMDFYNEDSNFITSLIEGIRLLDDNNLKCNYLRRLVRTYFRNKAIDSYPDYMHLCKGLIGHTDYQNYNIKQKHVVGNVCQDIAFWSNAKEDTDNAFYFSQIFIDCYKEVLENDPDNESIKNSYAIALSNMGDSYLSKNEYTKAIDCYQSITLIKTNESIKESYIEGENRKSLALQKMIQSASMQNDIDGAKQYAIRYLKCVEDLNIKFPCKRLTNNVVTAYGMVAMFFDNVGDYDAVIKYAHKAIDLLKTLLNQYPDSEEYLSGYATILMQLGTAYSELEETEKAKSALLEADKYFDKVIKINPENPVANQSKKACEHILNGIKAQSGNIYEQIGALSEASFIAVDNGEYDKAIRYSSKVLDFLSNLNEETFDSLFGIKMISDTNSFIADIYFDKLEDFRQAEIYYRKAIEINLQLYEQRKSLNDEEINELRNKLSRQCRILSQIAIRNKQYEEAMDWGNCSLAFFKKANTNAENIKKYEHSVIKIQEELLKIIQRLNNDIYFDYIFKPWIENLKQENGISNFEEAVKKGEIRLFKQVKNISIVTKGLYDAMNDIAKINNINTHFNNLEINEIFPFVRQKTKNRIESDLDLAVNTLKEVYKEELAQFSLDMDDDNILDYAEKASDNALCLAIIALVECKVEYAGLKIYDYDLFLRIRKCLLIQQGKADYNNIDLTEFFKDDKYANEFLASYWKGKKIELEFGHNDNLVKSIPRLLIETKSIEDYEIDPIDDLSDDSIINFMMNADKLFNPSAYFLLSIVAAILCLPLGIIALYFSYKTKALKRKENSWDARITSHKAKKWAIGGIVTGIILWALYIINIQVANQLSTQHNVNENIYTVGTNVLNIREGAGTTYSILGTLSENQEIEVVDVENNWAKINVDGKTGFVNMDYLIKKTDNQYSNNNLSPEQLRMSGRKAHGLLGMVKSATYSSGVKLEFNKDGNLISGGQKYESPVKYVWIKETYTILFPKKNLRYEKWNSGTSEDIGMYYYFDDHGRITSYANSMNYTNDAKYYQYEDENKLLPAVMTIEEGDETGTTRAIHKYTYLETDSTGNWTRRSTEKMIVDEDYETGDIKIRETSSFIETAKYTYY